ncbi:MAG: bacterial transcriptional activator domain-containing protein [Atopobiaceae bacterium]|jgi:DNA-binding SARP family transcriptional activator|nr:bacterial transcriptional activator domain-containing protein [Atopobiaceae bacterium]
MDHVREAFRGSSVVVLSSEAGMGKRTALSRFLRMAHSQGATTFEVELSERDEDDVTSLLESLLSAVDEVVRGGDDVAIGLNGLPGLQEDCAARVAGLIDRMASVGCEVMLTMKPEAENVLEDLPSAVCIHADLLLVHEGPDLELVRGGSAVDMRDAIKDSNGVPALVAAALADGDRVMGRAGRRSRWRRALDGLATDSLRRGIMSEERRLRAAMVLLGTGSFEEVRDLGVRVSDDILVGLSRDAPLFGVDLENDRFSCVDPFGDICPGALADVGDEWPDLALAASRRLLACGRFRRGGLIAERCLAADGLSELVREWPAELICGGHLRLVRDALSGFGHVSGKGLIRGEAAARVMSAAMTGGVSVSRDVWETATAGTRGRGAIIALQTRLMCASRLLRQEMSGPRTIAVAMEGALHEADGCDDVICRAMALHLRARRLLLGGDASDAYNLLVTNWEPMDGGTLPAVLLHQDHECARLLMGVPPGALDLISDRGCEGFTSMEGYHDIGLFGPAEAECIRVMTVGRSEGGRELIDRASRRAARRKDHLSGAVLMVAASGADVRDGQFVGAIVRSRKAAEIARRTGSSCVETSARCVELIASVAARKRGDDPEALDWAEDGRLMGGSLGAVLGALAGQASQTEPMSGTRPLSDVPCEAAALPVLALVCDAGGEFGEKVRGSLPERWSAAIERQKVAFDLETIPEAAIGDGPGCEMSSEVGSPLLEVRMMGKFMVRLGDECIPESAWKRRKSATMLAALVATKGHQLPRIRILQMLWPDADAISGRRSIYSALSSLRSAIGQRSRDSGYVESIQGSLRLNPDMVRCDVDEVEALAREVLGCEDDLWIMERCHEMERLYVGDMFVPPSDPTGLFSARRAEIARLVVDAMLAGGEAALRMDRLGEAVWFARKALDMEPWREDVVGCLVKALVGSGRRAEATSAYEAFARASIEGRGTPPTAFLRGVVSSSLTRPSRRDWPVGSFKDVIDVRDDDEEDEGMAPAPVLA